MRDSICLVGAGFKPAPTALILFGTYASFRPMTAVDMIIFDLDGTLIDSRRDIAHCVNWTLNDLGLPDIDHELIYTYVGHGVRSLMEGAVKEAHGEDGYDLAIKSFDRHYSEHLLDHTCLFPGMAEVLEAYNDKKLAVITNKPQKYTDPIIEGLGLSDYFESVLGREACANPKPHPAPIHKVMENHSLHPQQAVIIGDTEIDIEAGKSAGILTCGVLFGFGEPDLVRDAAPDFLVNESRELLDIFV